MTSLLYAFWFFCTMGWCLWLCARSINGQYTLFDKIVDDYQRSVDKEKNL